MSRFEGKRFVVTGGSGGIGLATADRLAAEGARVLVTGTNPAKLEEAKRRGHEVLREDAGSPEAGLALAEAVKHTFDGQLDGVFLNAGYGQFVPHDQADSEQFDRQFGVNVRGVILHARHLSPLLSDGGSVVINTSVVQDMGMKGSILYGASKGALGTAVRVLAAELAERNVRVNAVSPGPIGSDFFDRTGMDAETIQGMAAQIAAQVPLGRFGEPREVASVVAFLLSEDASFVTGSEVVVDGGMTRV